MVSIIARISNRINGFRNHKRGSFPNEGKLEADVLVRPTAESLKLQRARSLAKLFISEASEARKKAHRVSLSLFPFEMQAPDSPKENGKKSFERIVLLVTNQCGIGDGLHPLDLLCLVGRGDEEGLLAVVDVEAVLGAHPRLALDDGELPRPHVAVDAEVEAGVRRAVRVEEQVGELEIAICNINCFFVIFS